MNGYAYSNNSPITRSDPTGLWSIGNTWDGFWGKTKESFSGAKHIYSTHVGNGLSCATGSWGACKSFGGLYVKYHPLNFKTHWDSVQGLWGDGKEIYNDYKSGHADTATGKLSFFALSFVGLKGRGKIPSVKGAPKRVPKVHVDPVENAGKCSFTPDTRVLTGNGKTKRIGKIKPGDHVVAADPETGKREGSRTVTAAFINHDNDLVDLSVRTSHHRVNVLHTTSKHPFWDDTLHAWVPAGQLVVGHALTTADGHQVQVSAVRARPGVADMYNLTVDDLHTYYVLAGTTPVLVHNDGGARFNYLDRPGYSNYMLVDRGGNVYYSGTFGPGETPAGVQYRHANNNNRFNPADGDTMRVVPGSRTYGESRLMEQRLSEQYGTYIGRDGSNYRGNRQNPLAGSKLAEYEGYEATKLGGCP
ncbi:polymorphic toxin-type HINT domain-containing protein [Streptomyces sp. NBC_01262]|uniref:polymorphic toxin-type HINT domain-containing protein n=1 Tax=Streptomyces sp. NBC_01262 TaxID=2903803 RepID=UPI002E3792D0|nr:polymorphic toxin-type HINT domain-containing protein [Streptomyces sp. NBC_01262]